MALTYDEAKEILAINERGRLRAITGQVSFDWVAKARGISLGEALSLVHQAQDVVKHGELCPTCNGTGRKPLQEPLRIPSFRVLP